eukprot:7778374-Heterocapsa_arctica.AAC.1
MKRPESDSGSESPCRWPLEDETRLAKFVKRAISNSSSSSILLIGYSSGVAPPQASPLRARRSAVSARLAP